MAALCKVTKPNDRIVICGDAWIETDWAGGNIGFKVSVAGPQLPALYAGDPSQAEDLLATSREVFKSNPLKRNTVFDILHDVVSAHKAKLCDRYLQAKLGIPYERFLQRGASEIDPDTRNEVFSEVRGLDFGCQLVISGFIDDQGFIFYVASDGRVTRSDDFAVIGSGSLLADASLFRRDQSRSNSVERTIYNLYEAARLAQIAPGVGETKTFSVLQGSPNGHGSMGMRVFTGLSALEAIYSQIGPKDMSVDPVFDDVDYRLITTAGEP